MKKMLVFAAIAVVTVAMTGCRSTKQDHLRASLDAKIVPAKFKPVVEVMKGNGMAHGEATRDVVLWIVPTTSPDKFSLNPNAISFFEDKLKSAAVYDACKKSGADIILAPRFTEESYCSFLWFRKQRKVTVDGIPAKITGAEEIPVEQWPILFGTSSGTQLIKTETVK